MKVLAVLLLLFVASMCFDWSGVKTAKDMMQVLATEFKSLTTENAKQISKSSEACAGFSAEQIKNIPNIAFGGFNSKCVKMFNADTCLVMSAKQWFNVLADAFTGLTANCVSNLDPFSFSDIMDNQFEKISPISLASIKDEVLYYLHDEAYKGMTADQLSHIQACDQFSEFGFANIKADTFKGFKSTCLSQIGKNIFSKVNQDQIANLSDEACTEISKNTYIMTDLPSAAYSGFTKSCVSQWFNNGNGCVGIQMDGVTHLTDDAFGGLTASCFKVMPSMSLFAVKGSQMVQLSNDACLGITAQQMGFLSVDGYSGLNPGCLKNLSNVERDCCGSFSDSGFGKLTDEAFMGINKNCLSHIKPAAMQDMNKIQMRNIPAASAAGFTAEQFKIIPRLAYLGISGAQTSYFQDSACKGLSKYMSGIQDWTKFSKGCIANIPPVSWSIISDTATEQFDCDACSAITGDQFNQMDANGVYGMDDKCVACLSVDTCSKIEEISHFGNSGTSGLTEACIHAFKPEFFVQLDYNEVRNLNPLNCGGITYDQMKQIRSFPLQALQSDCFSHFNPDACRAIDDFSPHEKQCGGMKAECLKEISSEVFATCSSITVYHFAADAISGISPQDLSQIKPEPFEGFNKAQLPNFTPEMCAILTSDQFCEISPEAAPYLPISCFSHLNSNIMTKSTPRTMLYYTSEICAALPKNVFASFPSKNFGILPNNCLQALNESTCASITKDQLLTLKPEKFENFSAECVAAWSDDTLTAISSDNFKHLTQGVAGLCVNGVPDKLLKTITSDPTIPSSLSDADLSFSQTLASLSCWDDLNDDYVAFPKEAYVDSFSAGSSCLTVFFLHDNLGHDLFLSLRSDQMAGLREGHARYFSTEEFSFIQVHNLNDINDNFWLGLGDYRVVGLTTEMLNAFAPKFNLLGKGAVKYLTESQLDMLETAAKAKTLTSCIDQGKEFSDAQLQSRPNLLALVTDVIRGKVGCTVHHYPPVTPHGHSSSSGSSSGSTGGKHLDWSTVKTADQMAAVDKDYFSTMTPTDVLMITAKTILCGAITGDQISNIPDDSFSQFTKTCVAAFSDDSCGNVSPYQWGSLKPNAFGGITKSCASHFYTLALAGVSAEQVAQMTTDVCVNLSDSVIRHLDSTAYSGLTKDCISQITACANLNEYGISQLSTAAFGGLQSDCLASMGKDAFKEVTKNQIAALTPKSCMGFSTNIQLLMDLPPTSYAGFTEDCVFHWINDDKTCSVITSDNFDNFSNKVIGEIGGTCVSDMPKDVFSKVTKDQIAALDVHAACNHITSDQMSHMSDEGYSGLNKSCIEGLSTEERDACGGMTKSGFTMLTDDAISGINSACLYNIKPETISALNAHQAAEFTKYTCMGFNDKQLKAIDADIFGSFTSDCVSKFLGTTCNVLPSLDHFKTLAGLQKTCVANIPAESFAGANDGLYGTLTASGCAGITADQFSALDPMSAWGFKSECVDAFDGESCVGIKSLKYWRDDVMWKFKSDCLSNIIPFAYEFLTKDQVHAFDSSVCNAFNTDILKKFSHDALSGLTKSCVENLSPDACFGIVDIEALNPLSVEGLESDCMKKINPMAFIDITDDHVSNISPSSIPSLPPKAITSIPSAAFGGFTVQQIKMLTNADQCKAISGDQFTYLKPSVISALQGNCIANFNTEAIFNKATKANLASFQKEQCSNFPANIFKSLDASLFDGFSQDCLTGLSAPACVEITPPMLQAATLNKLQSFKQPCVSFWQIDTLKHLTVSQVNNLTNGLGGVCLTDSSAKMIALLGSIPDLPSKLSMDASKQLADGMCWNALNADMGNGVIKANIKTFDPKTLTNLGVFYVTDTIPLHIHEIPKTSIIGIREGQARFITAQDIASITPSFTKLLSANVYLGIDDTRVQSLSVDIFKNMKKEFKFLSVKAIQYLTDDQLNALNEAANDLAICDQQAAKFTPLMLKNRDALQKAVKRGLDNDGITCPQHHYDGHSSSSSSSTHHSSSGSSSSSSSSSSSGKKPHNSGFPFILLLIVLVLVVAGSVLGYVLYKRHQNLSGETIGDLYSGDMMNTPFMDATEL